MSMKLVITWLEIIRRERGWSQKTLSLRCTPILHQGTISLMERGGRVTPLTQHSVAKALGWAGEDAILTKQWDGTDVTQWMEPIDDADY